MSVSILQIGHIGEAGAFDSVLATPAVTIQPLEEQTESRSLKLQPSDTSVESGLLFTRTIFPLIKTGRGILSLPGISQPVEFKVPESEVKRLLYKAKLYRKLKYIERVFNVILSLPEEISSEEVKSLEIVFRGITEGAFSMREPQATFRISPQDIDLNTPPYFGPGQFDASVGEDINLLGQRLKVGPITVRIDKAELASPGVVDQIQKGSIESVVVRFEILDNQIRFRFEDYIKQPREHLLESLECFKQELALVEPKELVDLVSDPLAKDVSSFEAAQIAVGWTQHNDLPDRYCPQEPEFDSDSKHWRVPIYLIYTSGEGGPVGEIIIDVKTGEIVSHTPIEEIRSKGLALAEQILHA